MKAQLFSLVILASMLGYSNGLYHAKCKVEWTVARDCVETQALIIAQMIEWDNDDCGTQPGDTEPHGQKCLYKHTGTEGFVTTGTHTTPIMHYVDNLVFTFHPTKQGCLVDGYSESVTDSIYDYGTNFCNLFNLLDGSGLTQDPGFTETTNDAICTQRSEADCEVF